MSLLLNKTMNLLPESPRSLVRLLAFATIITIVFAPGAAYPEEKVITAAASYLMGDGETPSFAEAMVLQKAKQTALEEAGTYVQSYTKAMNFDITTEEIQTITGGLLKTEILKKTRTLVGDGVRFDITIKATVAAEKMEELARRIKGKNVAQEYAKLQGEYARLSRELAEIKQSLSVLPSGPDRQLALDRLQGLDRSYRALQETEVAFMQRLVSGETLHSVALAQISNKDKERHVVDALISRILNEGHIISIGEPVIQASLKDKHYVSLSVPVTLQASTVIRSAIEDAARSLGGSMSQAVYGRHGQQGRSGLVVTMGTDLETVGYFQHRVAGMVFVLEAEMGQKSEQLCYKSRSYTGIRFFDIDLYDPVFSINPAMLSSRTHIGTLSVPPFYQRGFQTITEDTGAVVIFDTPVEFSVRMNLRMEDLKRITALKGSVREGQWDNMTVELDSGGIVEHSTVGLGGQVSSCY